MNYELLYFHKSMEVTWPVDCLRFTDIIITIWDIILDHTWFDLNLGPSHWPTNVGTVKSCPIYPTSPFGTTVA